MIKFGAKNRKYAVVFPGDSVSYKIEFVGKTDFSYGAKNFKNEYRMLFSGKNAANYNYSYDLRILFSDTNSDKHPNYRN